MIGAIVILLAGLLVGGTAAAAETIRFANYLPPRSVGVSKIAIPWSRQVEEASGGAVKVQGFWGGALGRSPFKQYRLVTDGSADLAQIGTHYVSGQWPDNDIMELPFLFAGGEECSKAMWRLYKQSLLRGYDDVKVVSVFCTDLNTIATITPITSLAGVRGMKIRSSGTVSGDFLRHLGAVPVSMPVSQVSRMLSRKVMDGAMIGWSGVQTFRIQNFARGFIDAPIGPTTFTLAMNRKTWEGLPAKAKETIDRLGGETLAAHAGKAHDDAAAIARARIVKERRHKVVVLGPDALNKARADAQPVVDGWIKKTPDGAKKLAALEKIIADIRAGK